MSNSRKIQKHAYIVDGEIRMGDEKGKILFGVFLDTKRRMKWFYNDKPCFTVV